MMVGMAAETITASVIYARVSTIEQSMSGLGIAAQTEQCAAYATAMGYLPTDTHVDDGVSGTLSPWERPAMSQCLDVLANGQAAVLIVASLSRLGRRTADVLRLADLAHEQGWALVILDLRIDTTTPTGRMMLTVLAAVAQLERDLTAERTTAALQAAKRRGQRLGAPVSANTRRAGARAVVLRERGMTWRRVADELAAEGYLTARGLSVWHPATAQRAVRSVQLDREAAAARAA